MKYKIDELAKECGVSEQAIRYYFQANSCAKNGKRWNPTDDELAAMFRHYGKDYATFAQNYESKHKHFAQETENNHKEPLNDETAGENADSPYLELLRQELEILNDELAKKDEQISWYQTQIESQNETIKALTAAKAIDTFADNKDALLVEPIQDTKEKESAADATPQSMTNDEWANLGTWERIKRAWKGVLNG